MVHINSESHHIVRSCRYELRVSELHHIDLHTARWLYLYASVDHILRDALGFLFRFAHAQIVIGSAHNHHTTVNK